MKTPLVPIALAVVAAVSLATSPGDRIQASLPASSGTITRFTVTLPRAPSV